MNDFNQMLLSLVREMVTYLDAIPSQPEESVHGLRKRSKFIRALLKMHPDLDPQLAKLMKTLSCSLAPYRDAQANLETFETISFDADGEMAGPCRSLLLNDPCYVNPLPRKDIRIGLAQDLASCESILQEFGPSLTRKAVEKAIRKSYKRSRKRGALITMDSGEQPVHEWRKAVKRLWYQLRLVFGDADLPDQHIRNQLDALASSLGLIHDLDMLRLALDDCLESILAQRIDSRRNELLRQALQSAPKLFELKPKHFIQTHLA